MEVREKMAEYRNRMGYTIRDMARKAKTSTTIIKMVEEGEVTHPNIARRIGEAYRLTEKQTWDLMPEIHRPDSPRYDPDHYKALVDILSPEDARRAYIQGRFDGLLRFTGTDSDLYEAKKGLRYYNLYRETGMI